MLGSLTQATLFVVVLLTTTCIASARIKSDNTTLRITVVRTAPPRTVTIVCDGDTLSLFTVRSDTSVTLSGLRSFVVNIEDLKTGYFRNVYIRQGTKDVTIKTGKESLSVMPVNVEMYSDIVKRFIRSLQRPYYLEDNSAIDCIDTLQTGIVVFLQQTKALKYKRAFAQHFVRDWINPTSMLLTSMKNRILATSSTGGTDQDRSKRVALSLPALSTEGIWIRNTALQSILYKLVNDISRQISGDSQPQTMSMASAIVHIDSTFDRQCTCELVAASLQYTSIGSPGFVKGNDATLQLLLEMSSNQQIESCVLANSEYRMINRAVNATRIDTIKGIDPRGSETTITTVGDSLHLLHFWGTWCQPCLNSIPEINSLSDSLKQRGIATLHVAYEPYSTMKSWQGNTFNLRGQSIAVAYDGGASSIVNDLYIRTFPTYILVDRKGELVIRTNSVDRIRKTAFGAKLN